MNNFVIGNSIKSKLKILRKLGQALGIVGKSLKQSIRFLGGDFVIFRPKVGEMLNFLLTCINEN